MASLFLISFSNNLWFKYKFIFLSNQKNAVWCLYYKTFYTSCDEHMTFCWSKCHLELNREENVYRGNDLINNILIVVLINIICPPQLFLSILLPMPSPSCSYAPSLSLSHTHSLCLSTVLLDSPPVLLDIKTLATFSSLSLFAIKLFDTHHCFT